MTRFFLALLLLAASLPAQPPGRQTRRVTVAVAARVHNSARLIDTHNDIINGTVAGLAGGKPNHRITRKISGENTIRMMEAVERTANSMR